MLRIARNHCLDVLRRRLPEAQQVALDAEPGDGRRRASSPIRPRERGDDVARAPPARGRARGAPSLALPPNYREVVHLFHVEHLSYKEIAATLDVPIGTVMTWLHRARAQLKDGAHGAGRGGHDDDHLHRTPHRRAGAAGSSTARSSRRRPPRSSGTSRDASSARRLVESYRVLAGALEGLAVSAAPRRLHRRRLRPDRRARARRSARAPAGALGILGGVAVATRPRVRRRRRRRVGAGGVDGRRGARRALARAVRIGAGFVPALVGAFRLQIILAAAAVAVPLLVALARLMPAPEARSDVA